MTAVTRFAATAAGSHDYGAVRVRAYPAGAVPPRPAVSGPAGRVFVRSLFFSEPAELTGAGTPGICSVAEYKAAGCNAVEISRFWNLAFDGRPPGAPIPETFALWQAAQDAYWAAAGYAGFLAANDLLAVSIGDAICRNAAARRQLLETTWGYQAVEYYAALLAGLGGRVVLNQMVDESGGTADQGDALYAVAPAVATAWRAGGGPPLGWPAPVSYFFPPAELARWVDPLVSDTCSAYWGWSGNYVEARGGGFGGTNSTMGAAALSQRRLAGYLAPGRPWLTISSGQGAWYEERDGLPGRTPGDVFFGGHAAPHVLCGSILLTAALGFSGVRVYGGDWSGWRSLRASPTPGPGEVQTGIAPDTSPALWLALTTAFGTVAAHEARLLGVEQSCQGYGPDFVSSRWAGGPGVGWVEIAVNRTDFAQRVPQYVTAAGATAAEVVRPWGRQTGLSPAAVPGLDVPAGGAVIVTGD